MLLIFLDRLPGQKAIGAPQEILECLRLTAVCLSLEWVLTVTLQ